MSIEKSGPPIVIVGDVVNGFEFVGPFESPSQATEWAIDNVNRPWELTSLTNPKDYTA